MVFRFLFRYYLVVHSYVRIWCPNEPKDATRLRAHTSRKNYTVSRSVLKEVWPVPRRKRFGQGKELFYPNSLRCNRWTYRMQNSPTMQETDDLVRGVARVLLAVLILFVVLFGIELYKGSSSPVYHTEEERDFILGGKQESTARQITRGSLPP